jgi:hypothetical protein
LSLKHVISASPSIKTVQILVDQKRSICYNTCIETKKEPRNE